MASGRDGGLSDNDLGLTQRRRVMPIAVQTIQIAAMASAGSFGAAHAQVVRQNLYVADGNVLAAVPSGNTLYLAGSFTRLGPATGGGAVIDAVSGALVTWRVIGTRYRSATTRVERESLPCVKRTR